MKKVQIPKKAWLIGKSKASLKLDVQPKQKKQYFSKFTNSWKDFSTEDYHRENDLRKSNYKIRNIKLI